MNEKRNKIGADGGEKMKKQQAILFDLDGTLLNTLDDLTSSVNVTLQAHGFPLRRKEEIRKFLGNGSELLMRSALPEGTKEAVFAACLPFTAVSNLFDTTPMRRPLSLSLFSKGKIPS